MLVRTKVDFFEATQWLGRDGFRDKPEWLNTEARVKTKILVAGDSVFVRIDERAQYIKIEANQWIVNIWGRYLVFSDEEFRTLFEVPPQVVWENTLSLKDLSELQRHFDLSTCFINDSNLDNTAVSSEGSLGMSLQQFAKDFLSLAIAEGLVVQKIDPQSLRGQDVSRLTDLLRQFIRDHGHEDGLRRLGPAERRV